MKRCLLFIHNLTNPSTGSGLDGNGVCFGFNEKLDTVKTKLPLLPSHPELVEGCRRSKKTNPGYALILAITVIAAIMMLITGVVGQVVVFGRLTSALVDREQARMLALSGVQIAIGQLSQKSEEKKGQSATALEIKKIGPFINRWQKFTFSEESDGVDGACEIYLASEQGKVNINALYDFEQRKFIKNDQINGEKLLQIIGEKIPQVKDQFTDIVGELLKKRNRPVQDLTELLTDKKFKKIAPLLFVSPEQAITIFDLLTLETKNPQIQPWVLSQSLNTVLGLKNHDKSDKDTFQKLSEQSNTMSDTVPWTQKWDKLLAPMYGKQYSNLVPEVRNLFAQEFETSIFSVVSYGKLGNVMVKLYAILQKIEEKSIVHYCIKKIYWL